MRIAVTSFTGQIISPIADRALNNVEVLAVDLPEFNQSSRKAVMTLLRNPTTSSTLPPGTCDAHKWWGQLCCGTGVELCVLFLHLSDYRFNGTFDCVTRRTPQPDRRSLAES